ncbi:hypothetical protein [Nocardiopsis ansamitocini]|uniref:hypothetical protein n=1 Tax=Nocardiopsis ansamitocini TaxID=1670832 RepID=UPI0025528643|nr:hypothetical protein [Nocardiopsis ansamitocini]
MSTSSSHTPQSGYAHKDVSALENTLNTALGVLCPVFLAALGLVGGIVTGFSVSWLSWLWLTGAAGQALAALTVVLLLVAVFLACRVAGWAVGSVVGGASLALGWVLASLALIAPSGSGDVLMTSTPVNYVFLYGGVLAAVLGTLMNTQPQMKKSVAPPRT